MFSPSLISMMLHSTRFGPSSDFWRAHYEKWDQFALEFGQLIQRIGTPKRWPEVPVVASTDRSAGYLKEWFADYFQTGEVPGSPGSFFWGRIPVNQLVRYFSQRWSVEATSEYLDLGAPLTEEAGGQIVHQECAKFMAKVGTATQKVGVAFIDRGISQVGASPDTFGGKLDHVVTADVLMGDHSLKVLHVLLERLNHKGVLPYTAIACGLVTPPRSPIGLRCFQHANSVEMLKVAKAVNTHLSSWAPHPAVVTMSLGTHVGPHDGGSPLEDYLGRMITSGNQRFGFVAAGNDGRKGIYAKCSLSANIRDYLTIKTGPNGCKELLVELWWREDPGASVTADVDIVDPMGRAVVPSTGLRISSSTATKNLGPAKPTSLPIPVFQSLIDSRCAGNMSCIAFALSTGTERELASLTITIGLECPTDVAVNGWIVVSDDKGTAFVGGGTGGTLCVPGTSPELVCVAGVDRWGNPWPDSSRGPPCDYGGQAPEVPQLAHYAEDMLTGDWGTSYASPRACADAAEILANVSSSRCDTVDKLLDELIPNPPRTWKNSRVGFGAIPL